MGFFFYVFLFFGSWTEDFKLLLMAVPVIYIYIYIYIYIHIRVTYIDKPENIWKITQTRPYSHFGDRKLITDTIYLEMVIYGEEPAADSNTQEKKQVTHAICIGKRFYICLLSTWIQSCFLSFLSD